VLAWAIGDSYRASAKSGAVLRVRNVDSGELNRLCRHAEADGYFGQEINNDVEHYSCIQGSTAARSELACSGAAEHGLFEDEGQYWSRGGNGQPGVDLQLLPSGEPDDAPARRAFDDSHWPAIALPHTWSTFETTREPHPFIKSATERDDNYWWYGWGWYRKRFVIDPAMRGKRLFVEFDGVQKYSRVYLNGVFIGEHKGGYNSFCFDLTGHARFGEANLLAVRVSNRRDDNFGGIPPMHAGNYNVYGGIYRDVRLVFKDPLHIPYQGSADFGLLSQKCNGTFSSPTAVIPRAAMIQVSGSGVRAGGTSMR
jgi:hypothetical protein